MTQILPRFYRRFRHRSDPECSVDVSGFFPRIDISEPLRELACNRLGLAYEDVAEMTITPSTLSVRVYLRNEDGKKYLDGEHGKPACEVRTFRITT